MFPKLSISLSIPLLFVGCWSLLFLNSCSNDNKQDKHPEIKYFPDFNASNPNMQLQKLSAAGEDVRRVYVTRDKKRLIVLIKPAQKTPENNYQFRLYDEQLHLVKEITAPELDGLFGQDDLENIYAGKGYFEHHSFQYRPIQQLHITDQPGKEKKFIEKDMKSFEQMLKIRDTLLSFQRKDYKGSFYFLKNSGTVYQIFFKDCAYCESKYNAAESVSEYRAADNGADQVLKPSEKTLRGWIQKEPLFYYQLKPEGGKVEFKISYPSENLSDQMKKIDFAGKALLLYQLPGKPVATLYFFKSLHQTP